MAHQDIDDSRFVLIGGQGQPDFLRSSYPSPHAVHTTKEPQRAARRECRRDLDRSRYAKHGMSAISLADTPQPAGEMRPPC
jgi:hypothetical protein